MKHKYLIERNTEQKQVTIKEFSELDKEALSFLCQETYAEEKITAAITKGKDALIAALRTPNMYPSGLFANKIAEAVLTMFGPDPSPSSEVVLDDVDFIIKQCNAQIHFVFGVIVALPDVTFRDRLGVDKAEDKEFEILVNMDVFVDGDGFIHVNIKVHIATFVVMTVTGQGRDR